MPRERTKRLTFEPPVAVYGQAGVIWSKESQEWTWDAENLARIAEEKAQFEKVEDAKEEKRAYERNKKNAQNFRKAEEKEQISNFGFSWNDDDIPNPKSDEPRKLILASGVENPSVALMLIRNIPVACEVAGLKANRFVYRYGVLAADNERRKSQGLPPSDLTLVPESDFVPSDENLFLRAEVDRIYGDYAAWCGYYGGKTQAEWLADRVRFKYDMFFAGRDVFGIYADEHLHGSLMAPWFGEYSAARHLPRLYTQKDIVEMFRAFAGPDHLQDRLMLVFRGAGKSTWTSVFASQMVIRVFDVRLIFCTATRSLARELLDLARQKFVCTDFENPTRFQSLYPEHIVKPGKDSTNFNSPLRRLGLKEKTISITSMDSASSGKHADIGLFDDAIGDGTGESVLTHEAAVKGYDLRCSLIDPHGIKIVTGTPYTESDLYSTLISRNSARNGNLVFLRGPVWTVRPEFINTPTLELKPEMVEMLDHSGRIQFQDILQKAVDAPTTFIRQHLCEPCFSDNDAHQIFTRDEFMRGMLHESAVPSNAEAFASWDTSYGHSGGDFSCGLDLLRWRDSDGWCHLAIRNCIMEKLKPSELAIAIVDQYRFAGMKYRAVGIETPSNQDQLSEKIFEACRVRLPYGVIPLVWIPVDHSPRAKENRIKDLQLLTGGDPIQLHFLHGCTNLDLLWDQLENFIPGKKSGKSDERRDDGPDCLGLASKWLIQSVIHPEAQPAQNLSHEEQREQFLAAHKADEPNRNRQMVEALHARYFPERSAPAQEDTPGPSRYSPAGIAAGYRANYQKRIGGR